MDENGQLEMPVIGKIECKGKTRSELAQAIAAKIVEGGYINDPTVNVQFADMKMCIRDRYIPGRRRMCSRGERVTMASSP